MPSVANFTSLATPSAVGSGKTALETLLHEGGHAAHFANIDQATPLASQAREAPRAACAGSLSPHNSSHLLTKLGSWSPGRFRFAKAIRLSHPPKPNREVRSQL